MAGESSSAPAQQFVDPWSTHPGKAGKLSLRDACAEGLRQELGESVEFDAVGFPRDEISKLAFGLKELVPDVQAAVDELVAAGLAVRDGDRVRATPAALRFDQLWPVRT
jgi:hypothetical protein